MELSLERLSDLSDVTWLIRSKSRIYTLVSLLQSSVILGEDTNLLPPQEKWVKAHFLCRRPVPSVLRVDWCVAPNAGCHPLGTVSKPLPLGLGRGHTVIWWRARQWLWEAMEEDPGLGYKPSCAHQKKPCLIGYAKGLLLSGPWDSDLSTGF